MKLVDLYLTTQTNFHLKRKFSLSLSFSFVPTTHSISELQCLHMNSLESMNLLTDDMSSVKDTTTFLWVLEDSTCTHRHKIGTHKPWRHLRVQLGVLLMEILLGRGDHSFWWSYAKISALEILLLVILIILIFRKQHNFQIATMQCKRAHGGWGSLLERPMGSPGYLIPLW